MRRNLLVAVLAATPAFAEDKSQEVCGYMSEIVDAIQQARLDRVPERKVRQAVLDGEPTWPERYNNAIVHMTPWVYEQRMRDVRKTDLGEAWREVCVTNWDQIAHLYE